MSIILVSKFLDISQTAQSSDAIRRRFAKFQDFGRGTVCLVRLDSWVDRPNSFRSGKAASAPASAPTFGPLFVNTNFTWEFEGRKLIIEIQLHLQGPYVSMKHLHSLYEVTRCVTIEELLDQDPKFNQMRKPQKTTHVGKKT